HSGYIILTVLVVKTHGHIVTHGLAAAADVHVGDGEGSPVLVNAVYPVHVRIEVRIKAAGGFGDHFIRIHRGVVIIFAGFIVELHEGNAVQHFGHARHAVEAAFHFGGDLRFARHTAFGGDDEHAVRATRAVDGGGGSVF